MPVELAWPDGAPPSATPPRTVRVERFKPGVQRIVILLGDVVTRGVHWDRETRTTVPCFRPAACPLCADARWAGSWREEGYAPILLRNEKRLQWEQAVAAFTAGGLKQIGEAPHRGKYLAVKKFQNGTCTPMQVKELPSLPTDFPSLPKPFNVRPILMRVWFPQHAHEEPIEFIDPIPFDTHQTQRPAKHEELQLAISPELAKELMSRGLTNLATKYTVQPDGEPKANGHAKKSVPSVLTPEDAAEAERIRAAKRKPAEELTAEEAVDARRTIDFVLASTEARKNGTHPKGGAK